MKPKLIFLLLIWFVVTGTAQDIFQPIQISPENPESFQSGIMEAYEAGLNKVVIPSGVYRLPEPERGPYMVIEGSTIGGIILSPEIWWNEAGFSRDIIIRNNIIRHTGYSTVGSSDHQSGALTISGGGGEPDQIVPVYQDPKVAGLRPGHRNILIENNTIEDCDGVNMMIAVAENVLVKNNKFIRPQQGLSHRGQPSGVDPTALIWVFNSENVHFEGNTVRELGSFCKTLIKVNDKSKKISGIRDGVTPGLMPE